MFDYDGLPVGAEAREGLAALYAAFEEYVGETVDGLTEQSTDKSVADTVTGFLQTQARDFGD